MTRNEADTPGSHDGRPLPSLEPGQAYVYGLLFSGELSPDQLV
jgi:hypothetical protein